MKIELKNKSKNISVNSHRAEQDRLERIKFETKKFRQKLKEMIFKLQIVIHQKKRYQEVIDICIINQTQNES